VVEKSAAGHFRLPVDRAFSSKGFGTVVTGTLVSGSLSREQEVELYPTGRRLRVRGVQVYGKAVDQASAGQRTAANLADIEPGEITRGMVLAEPGRFRATRLLDCRLELLASSKPLKHRAPVHFHAGTAEIEAEVRLLGGTAALKPGESAYARLVLREPALILPGDRFIVRMFSPVVTIGGGEVLDTGGVRYRRSDNPAVRLEVMGGPDVQRRVALLVRESRHGLGFGELVARTGLTERELEAVVKGAQMIQLAQPQKWLLDHDWFDARRRHVIETLREFHKKNPLLPGIAKQDLRGKDLAKVPPFIFDALLAAAQDLVVEGETVRLRTHKLVLKQDEQEARAAIEHAFEEAGLTTPAVSEVLAKSGVEPARARTLLQILIRERRLMRVSEDLVFHQSAIQNLRDLLAQRKASRFNVGTFKEWTGISRKYAIPLLEYLDRERVTRREGDERVVL
jgi:selenocysteine-specific elongation factor